MIGDVEGIQGRSNEGDFTFPWNRVQVYTLLEEQSGWFLKGHCTRF